MLHIFVRVNVHWITQVSFVVYGSLSSVVWGRCERQERQHLYHLCMSACPVSLDLAFSCIHHWLTWISFRKCFQIYLYFFNTVSDHVWGSNVCIGAGAFLSAMPLQQRRLRCVPSNVWGWLFIHRGSLFHLCPHPSPLSCGNQIFPRAPPRLLCYLVAFFIRS